MEVIGKVIEVVGMVILGVGTVAFILSGLAGLVGAIWAWLTGKDYDWPGNDNIPTIR